MNMVSGTLNLYAQWGFPITWNSQGGTEVQPYVRSLNQEIGDLPATAKSGYTLNGWFTAATGGTKVLPTTPVTEAQTYYAQWKGITYTKKDPDSITSLKDTTREETIFKKIPKGTYNISFQKMSIKHFGSHTGCQFRFFLKVINSEKSSEFKYLDIKQSNTQITDDPSGISFLQVEFHISVNKKLKVFKPWCLRASGYRRNESSGYFKLTVKNIVLPYNKNDIQIEFESDGDKGDSECKGGTVSFSNGSSTPKITLTRL